MKTSQHHTLHTHTPTDEPHAHHSERANDAALSRKQAHPEHLGDWARLSDPSPVYRCVYTCALASFIYGVVLHALITDYFGCVVGSNSRSFPSAVEYPAMDS